MPFEAFFGIFPFFATIFLFKGGELDMKTKKRGLTLLAVALAVVGLGLMSQTAFAEDYEYAAFPAPTVNVTQIAYEAPLDTDAGVNAITIVPGGRVFAPFTGTIAFIDPKAGYVLFQSDSKVRYADGTLAFMTMAFMNDNNVADLYVGQKIAQYQNFYDAGNLVNGKKVKGTPQVNISIFRGKVNAPSVYGQGKYLAYKALYISEKTKGVVSYGAVSAGHQITNGGESDWAGLWTAAPSEKDADKAYGYPTISNANAPAKTIKRGSVFMIRGTISSQSLIQKVRVGVFHDKKGTNPATARQVTVGSRTYNIAYLDPYIEFDRLPVGSYYYIVAAKNAVGSKILVRKAFKVTGSNSGTGSYAKITGANYPSGTIRYGAFFSIRGTVSSTTKLTKVTAGVYTNSDATGMRTGMSMNPNAKTFSLTRLDDYVYFNKLPRGRYYYIVTATNGYGTKMLLRKAFTVA